MSLDAIRMSMSYQVFTTYLSGYEQFREYANEVALNKKVYFYFTGKKDETGKSWCPDCESAEPYVLSAIEKFAKGHTVVHVDVGDRLAWKNTQNSFRLDTDLRLQVIPTMILWRTVKRLDGELLEKMDVLELMFSNEDDN